MSLITANVTAGRAVKLDASVASGAAIVGDRGAADDWAEAAER